MFDELVIVDRDPTDKASAVGLADPTGEITWFLYDQTLTQPTWVAEGGDAGLTLTKPANGRWKLTDLDGSVYDFAIPTDWTIPAGTTADTADDIVPLTTVTPPGGAGTTTSYAYHPDGRLKSTRDWTYTFDTGSRNTTVTAPGQPTQASTWSPTDQLLTSQTAAEAAAGTETTNQYSDEISCVAGALSDGADICIATGPTQTWTKPDGTDVTGQPVTQYFYDDLTFGGHTLLPAGTTGLNLETRVVDPDGTTTLYGYDTGTGIETTTSDPSGTVTRAYDDWGRLTGYTDATGAITTYTYDQESNEISGTDPHATTTSTYDVLGRVTSMVDPTGTYTYDYAPDGTLAAAVLPNGVTATTTSRAGVGDLDTLVYTDTTGATLGAFDRDYDLEGRAIVEHRPGGERRCTYDGQGRLTAGTDFDGTGQPAQTRTYGYDANTNRTTKTVTGPSGAALSTEALTYNAADRLTARTINGTNRTYTYDPAGNQLTGDAKTYTWAKTDRIKQIATTVAGTGVAVGYDLDPLARTLRRTETRGGTNTSTTVVHYNDDTDTPTWAAKTTAGTTTNTRYVTNPAGVAAEHTVGGATVFPLHTPHGELWATTDTAGQITGEVDHDEFGVPLTPDGQTADYDGWLARQQRADEPELGLIQMGVRLYQADRGRFLSVDPIYDGSANDYDYANQDPVQNLDLDGREVSRDAQGGGRGGYIGGGREWNVGKRGARWGLGKWRGGKGYPWYARVPHYHRSVHNKRTGSPKYGQGLKHHRPWQKASWGWIGRLGRRVSRFWRRR